MATIDSKKIEKGVEMILEGLHCDLESENFKETPQRVARAYIEMLSGQDADWKKEQLEKIFSKSFPTNYKGIVTIPRFEAISKCPHHDLPIRYKIDIAYIAEERAVGLSKLPRVGKILAMQYILQEDLTQDILDTLVKYLKPKGAMVVVRGSHGCMSYRGIKENESLVITSSVYGVFEKDAIARQELLTLISNTTKK